MSLRGPDNPSFWFRISSGITAVSLIAACRPNVLTPTVAIATDTANSPTQPVRPEDIPTLASPTNEILPTSTFPLPDSTPTTQSENNSLDTINAGGILPTLGGSEGVSYPLPISLSVSSQTAQQLIDQGYTVNLAPGNLASQTACRVANPDECYHNMVLPPSLFYRGQTYVLSSQGSQSGAVEYSSGNDSVWYVNWRNRPVDGSQLVSGNQNGVPVDILISTGGNVTSQPANWIFEVAPTSVDVVGGVINIAGQDLRFLPEREVPLPVFSSDNVIGVLPPEILITKIEEVKLTDDRGNESIMQIYLDSKGRVMMVKTHEDSKPIVAPFGYALNNGVFRVFIEEAPGQWVRLSTKDSFIEMTKSSNLVEIAKIVDTDLISSYTEGTIHSYSEAVNYGIQAIPGRESQIFVEEYLGAFAKGPRWKQFWNDLGFVGNTGSELFEFLKTQVGGPENKGFWVPSVSPAGTEFLTLRSLGYDVQALPIKGQGFYLDSLPIVIVPYSEIRNNIWARALYQVLLRSNKNANGDPLYFRIGSKDINPVYGLVLHNSRLIWVHGVDMPISQLPIHSWVMGDSEGNRLPQDPKLLTAELMVYLKSVESIRNQDLHWAACVTSEGNLCPPQFEIDVTKDLPDDWFQFKQ